MCTTRKVDLTILTVNQLVDRFTEIGLAEDAARDKDDLGAYKRLYFQMSAISKELKARGREARLALTTLYTHPNPEIRLHAARCSYGVAPDAARKCLEIIRDSKIPPQYLDAGMSFRALDDGTSMLD
jgi:hypothetical protein